jgi:hypothetical protein
MATYYHGNTGAVKLTTNAVAAVEEFSYTEEDPAVVERAPMGSTAVTPVASGAAKGSGSITCVFDHDDATGQEALGTGDTVTLNLYPGGDTAGREKFSGSAVVTGLEISASKSDDVKATFNFAGVLTRSTVST